MVNPKNSIFQILFLRSQNQWFLLTFQGKPVSKPFPHCRTLEYLSSPKYEEKFHKLIKLPICSWRFIRFDDLEEYHVGPYMNISGLYNLYSGEKQLPYYLDIIHLFYTNMIFNNKRIMTDVKEAKMVITLRW